MDALLGTPNDVSLTGREGRHVDEYDPNAHGGVYMGFGTAGFRLHTYIGGHMFMRDRNFKVKINKFCHLVLLRCDCLFCCCFRCFSFSVKGAVEVVVAVFVVLSCCCSCCNDIAAAALGFTVIAVVTTVVIATAAVSIAGGGAGAVDVAIIIVGATSVATIITTTTIDAAASLSVLLVVVLLLLTSPLSAPVHTIIQ